MPHTKKDLLPLNRLDAEIQEQEHFTIVKHWLSGQQANPDNHIIWKRTFKTLGEGGFDLVLREECIQGFQKGSLRAVKRIEKPNAYTAKKIDYGRELEAIARFSKPDFARFFVQSSGWYESDTAVYVAMELMEHGSLQQYIGNGLAEKDVQMLVSQLLEGLGHMHAAGYAHRDLKPPNILVAQQGPTWHIKIADFGLSKGIATRISSLRTIAGTAGYVAPELLGLAHDDDTDDDDASPSVSYSNAVDIWAVGVIAFVLLVGDLPFDPTDLRHLRRYVKGKVGFPEHCLSDKSVSTIGLSFITSLVVPAPSNRPSVSESLEHRWFRTTCHRPARPTKPTALRARPSDVGATTRAHFSETTCTVLLSGPPETLATWTTKNTEYETTSLYSHSLEPLEACTAKKKPPLPTRKLTESTIEIKQDNNKAFLPDSGVGLGDPTPERHTATRNAANLLCRTTKAEQRPTKDFPELSWQLHPMAPFTRVRQAKMEFFDLERVRAILDSSQGRHLVIYGIGRDVSSLSDGTSSICPQRESFTGFISKKLDD